MKMLLKVIVNALQEIRLYMSRELSGNLNKQGRKEERIRQKEMKEEGKKRERKMWRKE